MMNEREVFRQMKCHLEQLLSHNDGLYSFNYSLSGVFKSCNDFLGRVSEFYNQIANNYGLARNGGNLGYEELCRGLCQAVLKKREPNISDKYTDARLKEIAQIFSYVIDLKRVIFAQFIHEVCSHAQPQTKHLVYKPNPMEMTKLIKISPLFNNPTYSKFTKLAALQKLYLRLKDMEKTLSESHSVVESTYFDDQEHILYPSPLVMSEYPPFKKILSIHSRLKNTLQRMVEEYANKVFNMKCSLGNLSNEYLKCVNLIKDEAMEFNTKNSELLQALVSNTLDISQLRIINLIRSSSVLYPSEKLIRQEQTFFDFEKNVLRGFSYDPHVLDGVFDRLLSAKTDIESQKNSLIEVLKIKDRKIAENTSPYENEDQIDVKERKDLIHILNEQTEFAYSLYLGKLDQIPQALVSLTQLIDHIGFNKGLVDFIESDDFKSAQNSTDSWMILIRDHSQKRYENNKKELDSIQNKIKKIIVEKDELQEIIDTSEPHRDVCISTCGHTFCQKNIEHLLSSSKCPFCQKSFDSNDIISINW